MLVSGKTSQLLWRRARHVLEHELHHCHECTSHTGIRNETSTVFLNLRVKKEHIESLVYAQSL